MWLSIPKCSKMINLDCYSEVCILTLNAEKGLFELAALESGRSNYARLTTPCSLAHAKNQFSNILHSLSRGAAICRIYSEDESAASNDENTT